MKPRLLSLILAALMLALALVSCTPEGPVTDGSTDPSEVTDPAETPLLLADNGQSRVRVIYSARSSDAVINSANRIVSKLRQLADIEVTSTFDANTSFKSDNDDVEILVGDTNRPATAEVTEGLRSKDYVVRRVGNKIVVRGGSDTSTSNAVDRLLDVIILQKMASGYDGRLTFSSENNIEFIFKGYSIDKASTILGSSVFDFKLAYSSTDVFSAQRTAILFGVWMSDNIGATVSAEADTRVSTEAPSIVFGSSERLGGASPTEKHAFKVYTEGNSLHITAESLYGYEAAYNYLSTTLFAPEGKTLTIEEGFSYTGDGSSERLKDDAKNTEKTASYRVIFNNIYGNFDQTLHPIVTRNRMIIEQLLEFSPDVLGFQECSQSSRGASSVARALAAEGYAEVEVEVTNSDKNNYTPLFYLKDRFTVVDSGYVYYDNTNRSGGKDASKSITWAVFEDKSTGDRFAAASTHYCYIPADIGGDAQRENDSRVLVDTAKKIYDKYNCPIIAGGDLNCRATSTAFDILLKGGFKKAFTIAESSDDTKTNHAYPEYDKELKLYTKYTVPPTGNLASIDHAAFYGSDKVTVKTHDVLTCRHFLMSSDHCPVMVDFDIKK